MSNAWFSDILIDRWDAFDACVFADLVPYRTLATLDRRGEFDVADLYPTSEKVIPAHSTEAVRSCFASFVTPRLM